MHNRRDALMMLGLALGQAAHATQASAQTRAHWRGYRRATAIDGAGGLSLGYLEANDPAVPGELAFARASGLTAVVLTVAPQGQFWLDDAARERTRTNIENWNAIIARHPSHLVAVRAPADLARAKAERKLGIGTDAGVAPVDRTPEFEAENREWVAYAVEDGIFQRGRPADLYTFIPDLNTADRFETLAAMLAWRGHSDARIGKILGGNFARVMNEVWA